MSNCVDDTSAPPRGTADTADTASGVSSTAWSYRTYRAPPRVRLPVVILAIAAAALLAALMVSQAGAGHAAKPASGTHHRHRAPSHDRPHLSAQGAILIDRATGRVLYSRAESRARPIASLAKLMTADLVLRRLSPGRVVTVTGYQPTASDESLMGLAAGEQLTVRDLLTGMLVASANDAAATLAVVVSGSQDAFVAAMNQRARELGLTHTSYAGPVGLDPRTRSSPHDLAILAGRLISDPLIARIARQRHATITGTGHQHALTSTNTTLGRDGVNGLKTGHTSQAGYCLVATTSQLIAVVLGAPTERARDSDAIALLRYGQTGR